MSKTAFSPADILIPHDCGLTKWAVVACDQYTSQPEYWERVDKFVGTAPSTLRLVLPETKLENDNVEEEIQKINETMNQYLADKRFRELKDSMLVIDRIQADGKHRIGLIGKLDLEEYSYEKGSGTPIRATEGTVLSRIPPRVKVRENAPIELPHIMVLIDDPNKEIIEPIYEACKKVDSSMLYMTTLMEKSGRLTAWTLTKEEMKKVDDGLAKLADPAHFQEYYNAPGKPVLTFAMGDGNHSLATAKACWEALKPTLSDAERENHPARYALVELVNLHSDALVFEAIHRVIFDTEPQKLLDGLLAAYPGSYKGEGEGHQIRYTMAGEEGTITVPNPAAQLEVGTLQSYLDSYLENNPGKIDYIHGEDVTRDLASRENAIGFILPAMGKDQLFPTVIFDGALPRKTFSMGDAADKRFYFEARRIK